MTRTGIEREDVREAVESLRDAGRSSITSKDVADELGTDKNGGTRSRIGMLLTDLSETDLVEVASRRGSQVSYRIPANAPVRADGGDQP